MPLSETLAIASLRLFDCAERQAAHELALAHPAEDEDGRNRDGRSGRELGPEQPLGSRERGDEGGERRRVGGGEVEAPERLVPAQDDGKERRGRNAGQRQGQE